MSTERQRFRCNELTSRRIRFTIKDADGAAVPFAALLNAELTLIDLDTGSGWNGGSPRPGVINSRDQQDVLNANNVTIHSTSGLVTWLVQADDNPIITQRRQVERHLAMFLFAWADGEFRFECELDVNNLRLQA